MTMLLIILGVCLFLFAATNIMLAFDFVNYDWDDMLAIVRAISIALIIFIAFLVIAMPISVNRKIAEFKMQETWFANKAQDYGEQENYLNIKKVELNQWLFESQYMKKTYPLWSFAPDEILEMKPID